MVHHAHFAVHDLTRAHDLAAKCLTKRLMPEAHAQQRRACLGSRSGQRQTDARLIRVARTGGQDDPRRVHRHRGLHVDLIVAADFNFGPEITQIVYQVVGEAIVVIDQEQHTVILCIGAGFRARGTAQKHGIMSTNTCSGLRPIVKGSRPAEPREPEQKQERS